MPRSELDEARRRRSERLLRSAHVARARAIEACIAAEELCAESRRLRHRPTRNVREHPA